MTKTNENYDYETKRSYYVLNRFHMLLINYKFATTVVRYVLVANYKNAGRGRFTELMSLQ
jgi:hypothetical protein